MIKIHKYIWIITPLYLIALCVLLLKQFEAEITIKSFGIINHYESTINLVKVIQLTNPALRAWRIWVMFFSLGVVAVLFDKYVIQLLVLVTSKEYRLNKAEVNLKFRQLKQKIKDEQSTQL